MPCRTSVFNKILSGLIVVLSDTKLSNSFSITSHIKPIHHHQQHQSKINTNNVLFLQAKISDKEDGIKLSASEFSPTKEEVDDGPAVAAVSPKTTINDRLLAEVQREVDKTKGIGTGGRSGSSDNNNSSSKKFAFRYGPEKTEEERLAATQEAQNLNGVHPWSTILSSFFALGMAFGVWTFTQYLGEVFSSHPITTDVYFLQRLQGVFRNMIMGLFSLMSGFFGVNGLGILFLGLRVAYGVLNGELDPTINNDKKADANKNINFSNVWDLMTMDKRSMKKKNMFDDL